MGPRSGGDHGDNRQPDATVAFDSPDWADEIASDSDVSYHLIAEVDRRPIGVVQICDPHLEPTHYWGEIEPGLRAIDIWIGADDDRGHGYGTSMMYQVHERCFTDPSVNAVLVDPLDSNVRAPPLLRTTRVRGGRHARVRRWRVGIDHAPRPRRHRDRDRHARSGPHDRDEQASEARPVTGP